VERVPDALTGRVAVETGLADALALSTPAIAHMAGRDSLGATEAVTPGEDPGAEDLAPAGYGGVAFRPEDEWLRQAWNRALADYVGGAAHRASLSAFGLTAAALPGGSTTADVLAGRAP
jgi:polar amino acid transport system substrate-binding protein